MISKAFFRLVAVIFLATLLTTTVSAANSLELSHSFPSAGDIQPEAWRLKLEFNQSVSVLEISKRVSIKINGNNASLKIINSLTHDGQALDKSLPPERKIFILTGSKNTVASSSVKITIAKGLYSADGKSFLANDTLINFTTKGSAKVIGFEPYFYDAKDKGVFIDISDNISDSKLKKHLRIFPPIGYFTINRIYGNERNRYRVSGKFATGRKYEVKINGGAIEGQNQIIDNGKVEFTAIGPTPEIAFTADRSVLELKSRQLVPLSFISVGNFKCQLMRVPAFFGPALESLTAFAEAEERRPTDSNSSKVEGATRLTIESATAKLDNQLLVLVKQLENLKTLANGKQIPDLATFLTPAFTTNSQGFLGSEDPDRPYYFSLPLDFRPEPEKGGSVIVNISETDVEQGQNIARLFQLTDLSLTYKFSRSGLLLWVTSISSGKPMADKAIMLLDKTGKSYFPGKTNHDGLLTIDEVNDYQTVSFKGEQPETGKEKAIIANLVIAAVADEHDSAFIKLNTNRFFSAAVQQSSPDQRFTLSSKGHVFTERGVYKPGETVFWKATVRKYFDTGILPPTNEKVRIKITTPRAEEIYSEEHLLNDFGTCSGSLQIKSFQPLGQYNLQVLQINKDTANKNTKGDSANNAQISGIDHKWDFLMNRAPGSGSQNTASEDESGDKLLTAVSFQVQEFEPPRHFVTLDLTSEKRKVKQIVGQESDQAYLNCTIKGSYYTGGPVRHAKVQWTAHLTERTSPSGNFPLFQFGNNEIYKELIESGNSILSKDGDLTISIPVSQTVQSGLNSIEISATILDIDARPATQVSRFSPEPAFRVGIAKLPAGLVVGQEFPIQAIVVDKNGNKLGKGEIQLEIMRKRWFYSQKRDSEGGISYNWTSGWVRSQNARQLITDGAATFELILAEGGDYMLQATYNNGNEESKAAMSFEVEYSYSSFEDLNSKSRTRSENEILLMPDKSLAAVNDKIRIRYSLPRPCEYALFTREADGILSARVVKLDRAQGEFVETMTEDCRPNVYVGLIAPSTRGNFPVYTSQSDSEFPRTYFGFTNIKVQNKVDSLSVAIAPEITGDLQSLPGDMQKLSFVITDSNAKGANAEVAICVVDEAILSLTGYVTPILQAITDFVLPLSVFTGDLRTSLISQDLFKLISTRALTGGDFGSGSLASDLEARKDFRPVAFWNPALLTDPNGKIEIEFKLPDSMTSYRIYAIALDKGAAFGSSERQLRVTREFYVEPGLPRFMTAGDKAVFPLAANNKGSQSGNATLKVAEATNITATIGRSEVQLEPYTNGFTKVTLEADNGAGEAKLLLAGSFNGMNDAIERTLPINPAATILHRQLSGHFAGSKEIQPGMPDYLTTMSGHQTKGAIQARLNVSTSPWTRIAPAMSYLMRYPYGCVEQTSSGIIPLAAMRGLIKDGKMPGFSIAEVDKFLETGINRLFKMQRNSGGFSYWTGEYTESWWGTQYAVLALHLAKRSGYPVDEARLKAATDYVRDSLFKNSNASHFSEGIMAMALVNLALDRPISAADMDVAKTKFKNTGTESEPLLLWAEALSSTTPPSELEGRINKLKPTSVSVSRGWYFSPVRQNALSLLAILAAKSSDKLADDFSGQLLASLKARGSWNSTADTGLALFALAEYFQTKNATIVQETDFNLVTAAGEKALNTGKYGLTIDLSPAELLAKEGIKITAPGKTLVNWSLEYSYPDLAMRTEPVDEGFTVEKTFENINGNKDIRIGDIIKVTLEFEDNFHKNGIDAQLSYLALEDPIPAGFTAINSALKNDALPPGTPAEEDEYYCDWENGAYSFYPDHKEFRNDRLLAFKTRFWSGRFRLVYYLRAICEGDFAMKPTQVSLMYNPEIYGMTIPKSISVLPTH